MEPNWGFWRNLGLTCCTAAYLRQGPNVALSLPWLAAIECFLACLGQVGHGGGGGGMAQGIGGWLCSPVAAPIGLSPLNLLP